jgi:DNA-directed RNA polymerase specialized sigma subunit
VTVREENEMKKEYLNEYGRKQRKIRSLQEQKQSIIESMQAAKAIEYSDMPKAHKQTDLSDYIVRLERLYERIGEVEQEKYNLQMEIESYIVEMDDGIECDILRKRYIERKTWDTIADELNYSKMQVFRIHGKALANFKLKIQDVI